MKRYQNKSTFIVRSCYMSSIPNVLLDFFISTSIFSFPLFSLLTYLLMAKRQTFYLAGTFLKEIFFKQKFFFYVNRESSIKVFYSLIRGGFMMMTDGFLKLCTNWHVVGTMCHTLEKNVPIFAIPALILKKKTELKRDRHYSVIQ